MARPVILLVNPNRMLPPIAPLGLEYVASDLAAHDYEPVLCDLTFAKDWPSALTESIRDVQPYAIGVSVRNLDDAYFASQDFILETTSAAIRHIKSETETPVVLGGVGFSCAPCEVLEYTGADYGIAGEGETAFPRLLDCLGSGNDPSEVPGAVYRAADGGAQVVPPEAGNLSRTPGPSRGFVDSLRYFNEGGQAGVETKRGCASACVYCVDPVAKGRVMRARPPAMITQEIRHLVDQGINVFHWCDSEFNHPRAHAVALCEALIKDGFSEHIRWYTYASPHPFDEELACLMARAGCAGINFGADHADRDMLERLGRGYDAESIRFAVQACKNADIAMMLDMLLGSPGETRETIATAIDFAREVGPDCVGLSCGVRVYPYTPLARFVKSQGPMKANPNLHGAVEDNDTFLRPVFYVDEAVGGDLHAYVARRVSGDRRFFHADPAELDGNYNYNNNSVLSRAIRNGARGAYWDILRKPSLGDDE